MTNYTIIGAGMAGLLASAMLRTEVDNVIESNSGIPNNHHALLRFRSSIVGDTLGIPFKKVSIMKGVHGSLGNPVADAIAYSKKVLGHPSLRSITTAQGEIEERWVAPPDFIDRMAKLTPAEIFSFDLKIKSSVDFDKEFPTISTMPMPMLMRVLGYQMGGRGIRETFKHRSVGTIRVEIPKSEAWATLYFPDPFCPIYRASLCGNEMIIELTEQKWDLQTAIHHALFAFGLDLNDEGNLLSKYKVQDYGKIMPIDEDVRKRFILWATEHYNIYSLGRFATWHPGLLMDDLVQDVRKIQSLVNSSGARYDHAKG